LVCERFKTSRNLEQRLAVPFQAMRLGVSIFTNSQWFSKFPFRALHRKTPMSAFAQVKFVEGIGKTLRSHQFLNDLDWSRLDTLMLAENQQSCSW
jgi:hypothetical protein